MSSKKRKAYERKKKEKDSFNKLVNQLSEQKLRPTLISSSVNMPSMVSQTSDPEFAQTDLNPAVFTGMDILDFLGKSALCISILVLGGTIYWLAGSFSVERIVGQLLFFALLGIPISFIYSERSSLPIRIIEGFIFFISMISALCFLPLAFPLFPLGVILKEPSYRPMRAILGFSVFSLFLVGIVITQFYDVSLLTTGHKGLYKLAIDIAQFFDAYRYSVGYVLLCSMGVASSLFLMVPELEKDPTRMSALPPTPPDKKTKPTISQTFPLPGYMPIYLHFQTTFQKFLTMLTWLCGGIGLISLFFWIIRVSLIPLWVTSDALAALSGALILQYFSRAFYVVSPKKKKFIRFTINPLMVDTHDIASEELAGIVLGRSHRISGILQKTTKKVCIIHVIFKTGMKLSLPTPDLSQFSEVEIEAHLEGYARRLAKILGCPFLNLLIPATLAEWKAHQENFFTTIIGAPLPPFFPTLWELFCESKFLDRPAEDEFEMVKSDLDTLWEWAILGGVSIFFAVTTIFMLSSEWNLLTGNPRFFYLILLDCSSIVVTLLAVRRWLIDEYYLFDLNTREIFFHSRILFSRRKSLLGSFSEVSHLLLEDASDPENKSQNLYHLKLVMCKTGNETIITNSSTKEIMTSRGLALAALLEMKCLGLEEKSKTAT
ncbi:MAG: hypothetical protein KKB51_18765 [Candidatus Riflebacteria bacterium]|nr:hypothetical protein [Candidatus Riflebacteria bacterium]